MTDVAASPEESWPPGASRAHIPLVTVIVATYNRSNVLPFAIGSALASNFTDFELIVVGDGCTDDSEAVVRAVDDPRVSFHNLAHNSGDEAVPHNEGLTHARGRLVAYLNHDDLWFPDHLETAVAGLEETGADGVFSLTIATGTDRPTALYGAMPGGVYRPWAGVPQSSWMLRRELLDDLGGWRQRHHCWIDPAQDLLVRAWRAGKALRHLSAATVLKVQAAVRPGVYANRESKENEALSRRLLDEPGLREDLLRRAGIEAAFEAQELSVGALIRLAGVNLVKRVALRFGMPPVEVGARLRWWRRGTIYARWRRRVGLPG
jgi:glycosyltransferase involved in cell wall biosynthesis